MSPSPLRIGTAGWSVSSIYSAQVPLGGTHLQRYARRLDAVEIDTSFYRHHQRKTYERWAASTPSHFRFSVKLPKTITHEQELADCGELLDTFLGEVEGLGDKLAILLVQLPPKLAFDGAVADRFFNDLRARTDMTAAVEPRHASWFTADVDDWLAERRLSRVAADPPPATGADHPGGWSGLAYYRWHGAPRIYYSDYDAVALASLHDRLQADRRSAIPAWCIFDNTASGAALGNALALDAALK